MSRKISFYTAYELVAREMGWRDLMLGPLDADASDVLTKKDFRRILMVSSLTTSDRKVNELWSNLTEWEIAKKAIKADVLVINLSKLRELLAHEMPAYKAAMGNVLYRTTPDTHARTHAHAQIEGEIPAGAEDGI